MANLIAVHKVYMQGDAYSCDITIDDGDGGQDRLPYNFYISDNMPTLASTIWARIQDEGDGLEVTDAPARDYSIEVNRKIKEVEAYWQAKIDAGFIFETYTYQIDEGSLSVMTRVFVALQDGNAAPSGGFWWDVDNVAVTMNDVTLKAMIKAVGTYAQTMRVVRRYHKDAVLAATTVAEVDAINFTTGWPTNEG